MIGDVTAQGAGRFCKPGVRYVALLPASARNGLNLRPVKQFDTATPHRDTLIELESKLKVKIINLLPKSDLPPEPQMAGNGAASSQNPIEIAAQGRAVKEEEMDNAAKELQEIDLMTPEDPAPARADRAGKRAPSVEAIDVPSGKRARHDNSAITTSHLHEREKTSLNTMEALQLTPAEAAQAHARFIQYEVLQGGQGQGSRGSDTRRSQSTEDAENPRVAAALDIMKAMNLGIADASRVHACFLQRQDTKQQEDRVGDGTP
ncbi:hypothetical protein PG991_005448 [Apiospora marii]|uniref:Uncharacterized protein n=1 Tax=Apiospora marii TaxID=335849 RepID=A0ABR1SBE9_9PEZI